MTNKTETTAKPAKRLLGRIVARELSTDEIEVVAGGRMAAGDTCSCGCPDDCGL